MIKRVICLFTILFTITLLTFAQDDTSTESDITISEESPGTASGSKIKPVLPQTGTSIIFIEGEDAVATNFNREPILNYSCSGYETLQLNQGTGLQGDSVYYADYVFYVEDDAVYEFWYGGTPPGNKDELLPSFSSPFHYKLDSYYEYDVYREDMDVVGAYAPAYYWNYVSDLTLSKGEHRITFEIPERRSYDSKFYFYLDNFFLVKKVDNQRVLEGVLPEVFPADMDDRSIDTPFKSIEDYEILIRDNPDQSRNYIEISMIYSLIGDYLSSLKNLRKAILLEPDDPDILLLIAKNYIWKGSYSEGLYQYSDLLKLVPEKIDIWTEAGKVAAWIGQYDTSIEFFMEGVEFYPQNLNLQTNLGITYLWSGRSFEAEKQFELVNNLSGDDLNLNKELAAIFEVNGYFEKSIEIYKKIITLYPEDLETRFLLEDAYIQNNQHNKIEALRKTTTELFTTSLDFEKVVQTFYNKQVMKEKVIADYEEELNNDPDNLILRKTLAEIYFWNGDKKKAINEYLNILTNYTYRNLRDTERSLVQYYEIIDRNYSFSHFLSDVPAYLSTSVRELNTDLINYNKTLAGLNTLKKKNEAAIGKGEESDLEGIANMEEELRKSEDTLAGRIASKAGFVEKYQLLIDQFEDDTDYLLRLITEETSANETFTKLTKGSNWSWDRSRMIKELEVGYENGLDLAAYVIGRIYQTEGALDTAVSYLDSLLERDIVLEDVPFAVFQTNLWLGNQEKRSDVYNKYSYEIVSYSEYLYDIADFLEYLNLEDDVIFGFLSEDPEASVKSILDGFSIIKKSLPEVKSNVTKNIISIHRVLEEKIYQGFYHLAEQTYLIRNELGDFYQNEKMFPEAIDQYSQVLAIDPWNLSAKYKLGQVYHWNGNWKKALDLYDDVYNEDPVFGNVTLFYNQLAREHADYFDFTGSTFADTLKMKFESNIYYNSSINGIFSLGLNYNVSNNRDYILGTNRLLQNLSVRIPVDLSLFVFNPEVGFYAQSNLINNTFSGTPGMNEFFGEYRFFPYAGVSTSIWTGPLGIYGAYSYGWEEESLQTGKSSVSYQKGEILLQVDFNYTQVPILKETSSLVSGFSRFNKDGNIIFGGSFEIVNEVKINKNPDISLNLSGRVIYEDSTKGSSVNYWAPEDSFSAGGGIETVLAFNLSDKLIIGDTLGLSANYFTDISDTGVDFTLGNTFNYTNGNFNGYIKFEGTLRDTMDYWSFSLSIGSSAGLPELLSL
jgi:tetratricopeptide (TPR) repeat protein